MPVKACLFTPNRRGQYKKSGKLYKSSIKKKKKTSSENKTKYTSTGENLEL